MKIVDAMVVLCAHSHSATVINLPSRSRDFAEKILGAGLPNASLAPDAEFDFVIIIDELGLEGTTRIAENALSRQMTSFMIRNGLNPDSYDMKSFCVDYNTLDIPISYIPISYRSDVQVRMICMAAIRK